MTRLERRERNRQAHAIRRSFTDEDYRTARAAGDSITWREVWAVYEAMTTDDVLALVADTDPTPAAAPAAPARKRRAPAHIAALQVEYRAARDAWEVGLEAALAGARRDGRPARGERYTDEERDYRAAHPAPVWRDWLAARNADARALESDAAAAEAVAA